MNMVWCVGTVNLLGMMGILGNMGNLLTYFINI
jgi:hypothetical protein